MSALLILTWWASDWTSDLGELEITRDGSVQHADVPFHWKRTSFVCSGWYALVNPPGPDRDEPAGCPAP